MEFLPKEINKYVEGHSSHEPELLKRLNRETHAKVMMPRMLSGHFQGRVLSMLSKMIKPKYILEIGTYTGYSAICLAEGLQEGGKLITLDINQELEEMVSKYFQETGLSEKIEQIIGNAIDIIPTLNYKFDIVFVDADKENYSNYYELIFDKVQPGGYIIGDNVLWSGKVVQDGNKKPDHDTQSILDFNERIQNDPRVENVLLPVRDGLMIARKL